MTKKTRYLVPGLFLVFIFGWFGCTTDFDITGQWALTATWDITIQSRHHPAEFKLSRTWTDTLTFTGTITSGTWISKTNPTTSAGTYTVTGDSVTFVDNLITIVTFTGTADGDNIVEGTMIDSLGTGSFTLNRL